MPPALLGSYSTPPSSISATPPPAPSAAITATPLPRLEAVLEELPLVEVALELGRVAAPWRGVGPGAQNGLRGGSGRLVHAPVLVQAPPEQHPVTHGRRRALELRQDRVGDALQVFPTDA